MPSPRIYSEYSDRTYFLTMTVVEWIDIFTSEKYFQIIIDALSYAKQCKALKLYAFVFMTNHIHVLCSSEAGIDNFIRDFKRHTTKEIKKEILKDNRKYILRLINNSFSRKEGSVFQLWKRENYPEVIESEKFFKQKVYYMHRNPVEKGYVDRPEDWLYSSAKNHAGLKGVIDVDDFML